MERQFLTKEANEDEYIELYRDMQPGLNVYWNGFGQPPVVSFRAAFDDMDFNRERQMKRELVKEITPVLHRLQEAFLIYEDQYDGEWDRGWCLISLWQSPITSCRKRKLSLRLRSLSRKVFWWRMRERIC